LGVRISTDDNNEKGQLLLNRQSVVVMAFSLKAAHITETEY
jgi:hypothetical protein